jgi:8-oxo-dGTP pyrophosphatase MutT (NUDIX family)
MSNVHWRPPQRIRPIAIALVYRGDELLVMAVKGDAGAIKGWRPPGGAIEFGESAEAAVVRELVEELGTPIRCTTRLCTLENLYVHEDARGHEIVFVFEAELLNPAAYAVDHYSFADGGVDNEVRWRSVRDFRSGAQALFPPSLVAYLR